MCLRRRPASWRGSSSCKKMAGFAAQEHIAEFKDGKCPVQLMVMKCDKFKGKGFDAFLMSQMWDCQEDRERIFRECRYQVVATDMLAKGSSNFWRISSELLQSRYLTTRL